jgi:hypothetical protein
MPFIGSSRTRRAVLRKRPSWWTPEGVLQRLQAGEFVMAVCEAARVDMEGAGVVLTVRKLRADISAWCESAAWGEQLRQALTIWKKERGSDELVLSKTWHDDFLSCMEVCEGNAERAAAMAGISYGIVLAVLDKRNKCHDAEFVEKFRQAELYRIGKMRELYMTTGEGEGKLAMHVQEAILASAMPAMHGQQQKEVHVTGQVEHAHDHDHRHQHLHALAPDIAREVVLASQARVRRLGAGREVQELGTDARDENRVIDVTPVAERARA